MISDLELPLGQVLTPEEMVRDLKHLPSAPKVLPRLKQMLSDGNSAMHEIVGLIRLDAGIVARVLQVANSAYFSKGVRCYTVDEAVQRVGYDQVFDLVSYAVASQVLVRPLEVYGIEADELWRMSVAGALAAEVLADCTGQDRDAAYTMGLLHCVGMVAIDEWALRSAPAFRLGSAGFPRESTEEERSKLGFTQAEAGGALLRLWGFPSSIFEPVRWQYSPRASAGQVRMSVLLYAAKWLRNAACGRRPVLPDAILLHPIGLTPTRLAAQAGEVTRRLTAISSLLEHADTDCSAHLSFPGRGWN